jgi:hypothetical protein
MFGNSWLAERQLAFQEGVRSMELVSHVACPYFSGAPFEPMLISFQTYDSGNA